MEEFSERPVSAILDGDHGLQKVVCTGPWRWRSRRPYRTRGGAQFHPQWSHGLFLHDGRAAGPDRYRPHRCISSDGAHRRQSGHDRKQSPLRRRPSRREKPVIFDMACSVAARQESVLAAQKRREDPAGWAIDKDGLPTEDAQAALEGLILPVRRTQGLWPCPDGECALTGANFGPGVGPYNNPGSGNRTSSCRHQHRGLHTPRQVAEDTMDQMIRNTRIPRRRKEWESFLPGEIEIGGKASPEGIPLSRAVYDELCGLGQKLGVKPDFV